MQIATRYKKQGTNTFSYLLIKHHNLKKKPSYVGKRLFNRFPEYSNSEEPYKLRHKLRNGLIEE